MYYVHRKVCNYANGKHQKGYLEEWCSEGACGQGKMLIRE